MAMELLMDKHKDIISAELIDFLLYLRYKGFYWLGHIKPVQMMIHVVEDLLTRRGRRRSKLNRIIHWLTGNTVYYLDYVLGSDANDGSAWGAGTAWKTITSGATAARIAPGDIIRIAKSGDAIDTGLTASWRKGPNYFNTTNGANYKAIESSTNATPIEITITGHGLSSGDRVFVYNHTTNTAANGCWEITRVSDNVFSLNGSVGNGTGGASGNVYWSTPKMIKLSAAVTAHIDRCESGWTAANSATVTHYGSGDNMEGVSAVYVQPPASPTTNKLYGYKTITEVNLSGYKQISLKVKAVNAVIAAGVWKVCLCSDTAGATPVNTIQIPAIPQINKWISLTIDTGGALGASIKSVAVYSDSVAPSGSSNRIYFDNILACKDSTSADAITLTSLVSKNSASQGGAEGWYSIRSIDGVWVCLDNDSSVNGPEGQSTNRGYAGATETVELYRRETIKTTMIAGVNTLGVQEVQDSGSAGNYIEFQGGYNTSSGSQDGETFFDGQNGCSAGIKAATKTYIKFNRINLVKYYYGFYLITASDYAYFDNIQTLNNNYEGMDINDCDFVTINNLSNCNFGHYGLSLWDSVFMTINNIGDVSGNGAMGLYINGLRMMLIDNITRMSCQGNFSAGGLMMQTSGNNGNIGNTINTIGEANGNGSYGGLYISSGTNIKIGTITDASNNLGPGVYTAYLSQSEIGSIANADNNIGYGLSNYGGTLRVKNLNTSGNTIAGVINRGLLYLRNAIIAEATEIVNYYYAAGTVYSWRHENTDDNHYVFYQDGYAKSQIDNRHTASGIAWTISILSAYRYVDDPIKFKLAEIACVANKEVTVNVYVKKSHASNIAAKLVYVGGLLTGTGEQTDTKANDTDWELLEVKFTPTQNGVAEIEIWAYYVAGVGDVYVDDITISQAA